MTRNRNKKGRNAGRAQQLRDGDLAPQLDLRTVAGETVTVPNPERLVHLQFRRFAGCPICNLHLHTFVRRNEDVEAAGINEVVVFHSTAEDLRPHVDDLPFAVVADADKLLYADFGVEHAAQALLDPRAWIGLARGVARSLGGAIHRRHPLPPLNPAGGRFGLPADFLIGPDGRIVASKYGINANDQWSVDELLAHACHA